MCKLHFVILSLQYGLPYFSALSMVFRCKTLFNSNVKPFHVIKKKRVTLEY